jgi:hypothetical protein
MPNTVLKIGDSIRIFASAVTATQLESGKVYAVNNSLLGPYLSIEDPFKDPENFIYEEEDFHDHILNSFRSFSTNCGVLLKGQKGQGKSVSAKKLALRANLPIIVINKKFDREFDLISFLNSIPCEYVLLIDEFEKLFGTNDKSAVRNNAADNSEFLDQNIFLSFLDGACSGGYKKLIILTCNNEVSEFLINRPGRIRFKKNYNFLSEVFYNILIDKYLLYPEFKKDLKENLPLRDATVDLVKSIVFEINASKKPYSSFKEWFNFTCSNISYSVYFYSEKHTAWMYVESISTQFEFGGADGHLPYKYNRGRIVRLDTDTIYVDINERHFAQNTKYVLDGDVDGEESSVIHTTESLNALGITVPEERKEIPLRTSEAKILHFKFVKSQFKEERIIK